MAYNKGDVIQLDGKNYRIIKRSGTIAEVVQLVASGAYSTTFASSATMTYEGSTLDTYLNTTFYNSLSAELKAAIVPKTIIQDRWANNATYDRAVEGKYGTGSTGNTTYSISQYAANYGNAIIRNCYALSVLDVLEYVLDTSMTDGLLQNYNVWKMFWNQTTKPSSTTPVWLSSAQYYTSSNDHVYVADGSNGRITDKVRSTSCIALPAFQIDLSTLYSDTAMVDTIALNGNLASIANTIRSKTGEYSSMAFPNGYMSKISGLIGPASGKKVAVTASENLHAGDLVVTAGQYGSILIGKSATSKGTHYALSPNGKYLTGCVVKEGSTYNVYGYDTENNFNPVLLVSDLGYENYSGSVYNNSGTRFVILKAGNGPWLRVYDTSTIPYTLLTTLDTNVGTYVRSGEFSPDDTKFAIACSSSPYCRVFDTTTTPYTSLATASAASGVDTVHWSPDGKYITLTGAGLTSLYIYDTSATPYTSVTASSFGVGVPNSNLIGIAGHGWTPTGSGNGQFVITFKFKPGTSNSAPKINYIYDGTIPLTSGNTGPEDMVIGCSNDGDWIALTPGTYYQSKQGGTVGNNSHQLFPFPIKQILYPPHAKNRIYAVVATGGSFVCIYCLFGTASPNLAFKYSRFPYFNGCHGAYACLVGNDISAGQTGEATILFEIK